MAAIASQQSSLQLPENCEISLKHPILRANDTSKNNTYSKLWPTFFGHISAVVNDSYERQVVSFTNFVIIVIVSRGDFHSTWCVLLLNKELKLCCIINIGSCSKYSMVRANSSEKNDLYNKSVSCFLFLRTNLQPVLPTALENLLIFMKAL